METMIFWGLESTLMQTWCLQPPEPKKPAAVPEFKLPDVSKGIVDTPKEIADKALPEALKQLPPPPTPSEPPAKLAHALHHTSQHL